MHEGGREKGKLQRGTYDEEGIFEWMEEVDIRVKVGQEEIKEDGGRMNQRKMEGQFLRLVMTSTAKLKDVIATSEICG